MKMRGFLIAAISAAGLLLGAQAHAQPYIGGSFGQSDIDDDIAAGLIDSGSVDGKDTAFKIFGGYQLTPNFAIEGAYADLGEATYSGTFGGAPVTGGKVEVSGFNVSAVGILPLAHRFSLFGKLGLFVWDAEASDVTGGVPFSAKADGTDLSFGLGGAYQLTQNLSLRAEWERFKLDNVDADMLSVGVAFRF